MNNLFALIFMSAFQQVHALMPFTPYDTLSAQFAEGQNITFADVKGSFYSGRCVLYDDKNTEKQSLLVYHGEGDTLKTMNAFSFDRKGLPADRFDNSPDINTYVRRALEASGRSDFSYEFKKYNGVLMLKQTSLLNVRNYNDDMMTNGPLPLIAGQTFAICYYPKALTIP